MQRMGMKGLIALHVSIDVIRIDITVIEFRAQCRTNCCIPIPVVGNTIHSKHRAEKSGKFTDNPNMNDFISCHLVTHGCGILCPQQVAHRVRNRKTSIMYALALGFIIFITVAYQMEIRTAQFRSLKT